MSRGHRVCTSLIEICSSVVQTTHLRKQATSHKVLAGPWAVHRREGAMPAGHTGSPTRVPATEASAPIDPESGESAPGGNRTRGLRFERPLLFGSPKRTVDH